MSEASLQKFTDEYLTIRRIENFRIPDGFFHWMVLNAPARVKQWFFSIFGAMPDNLVMIPIGEKYSLCVCLELKSAKGRLRDNQKKQMAKVPWQIARSPEQVMEIVRTAEAAAKKISEGLKGE